MLHFQKIVSCKKDVRSLRDERYKIDRYTLEYRDKQGELYRKSIETKKDIPPVILDIGEHETINRTKYQYIDV